MRRVLAGVALTAIAAAALPATAGAGGGGLDVQLVGPTAPLTVTATITPGFDCNPNSFVLISITNDQTGQALVPVSVTPSAADPNTATIVLPPGTAGVFVARAGCTAGELTIPPQVHTFGIAALTVTKVVQGTPPPGTTFSVNVDCEDLDLNGADASEFGDVGTTALPATFDVDLAYEASGGVGYVYTDGQYECVITEPGTGGATAVVIDPTSVTIGRPQTYAATVTNTFPIVVEPTFTG